MKKMGQWIRRVISVAKQDEGQGMVEYGLIIALVAVAVVITLTALGGKISALFTSITGSL